MDCQDQLYEEMSRFTHREFLEEYKNDLIGVRNKYGKFLNKKCVLIKYSDEEEKSELNQAGKCI